MYSDLKRIQELMWKNEDMPDQEDWFEMQDLMAALVLKAAVKEKKTDDLIKAFPFLYTQK